MARIFDATNGTRPSGWALTRASSASYTNSSGVLSTAASDAERLDYNGASLALLGLLIEPASANQTEDGNDLTNAYWTGEQIGTEAAGTGPDGTTANRAFMAAPTTNDHRLYRLGLSGNNVVKTWSLYYQAV